MRIRCESVSKRAGARLLVGDTKLRELERRWRETAAVDDEAAYLQERVRMGDLARERLELAAYCSHEGARMALPGYEPARTRLERWAVGLRRWGRPVATRGAIAAARMAVDAVRDVWTDQRIELVLLRAEEWLLVPCDHAAQAVREAALESAEAVVEAPLGAAREAASAGMAVAHEIWHADGGPRHVTPWGDIASVGIERGPECAVAALKRLGSDAAEEEIRRCMGLALSGWALAPRGSST
jgi:hypothetical protein